MLAPQATDPEFDPKTVAEPDVLLNLAKDLYSDAQKRKSAVDDKVKSLATLVGFLIPFVGAVLLPRLDHAVLVVPPLLVLLFSLLLVAEYFGIDNYSRPALDAQTAGVSSTDRTREILRSYLVALDRNDRIVDFRVSLFGAARRSVFLALLAVVGVVATDRVIGPPVGTDTEGEAALLRRLLENAALSDHLRGQAGPQGPMGPPGPAGAPGSTVCPCAPLPATAASSVVPRAP